MVAFCSFTVVFFLVRPPGQALAKVSNDKNGCPNEMRTLPDSEPNHIKDVGGSFAKMIVLTTSFLLAEFPTKGFHVSLIESSVRN